MDKLYTCHLQGRALLFTLLMLLITPLSIKSFGQSPCTASITRQATNGKSTNTNIYDDITLAMTNLLGDGTEAAWVLEAGGTFTENPDGTAHLQGIVKQFGDYATPRRMAVDMTLGGKSYTPGAAGPYNQTGVSAAGWYYYYSLSGTLTGLDALAGGQLSLTIHQHPFQVGIGANQLFSAEDQVSNGAGGWFEWAVVSQPTDNALQFTNYISGFTISDIAIMLSGTPSVPCPINGSIGDQVYCDVNNNGIFDAGDVVATGLTITLCDANFVTITTQAVDANGKYLFTNLSAGTYNVKFPEATLDGKPQRDLGPINVVLGAGQNFLDADKGYYKPPAPTGSIGDQVYCDINNNGIFDAGDVVATGLTITLCDANFVTITTQLVDANGRYLFTNLAEGTYNVKFPESTLDGKPQRVLGPINVVLGAGQNFLDADKGYYKAPVNPCLNDTEKPVFSNCPANIVKDVTNMSGSCWTITWTAPKATDNCSTPSVRSNYNSGCCLPVGVTTITYIATDAKGNSATCSFTVTIKKTSCTVSGNTISKSCANNSPLITGKDLGNYEYMWLSSTKNCPSGSKDVIAGATNKDFALSSCVSKTTYFVRCARPVGCASWGSINESNCITVSPDDCKPTCSVNFDPNKCYRVINKKSGKAVDVYGGGTNNNCNIIQWGYRGTANQQWRFCSVGSGYFKVMSRNSGKYLACHTTSNNANVYQYDYYSGGYKDWKVECVGNTGYYRLVHRASGKVLDISGGATADGANCIIYSWNGGDNQLFSIEEVTSASVSQASASMLAVNATAEADRVRLSWMTNTGFDNDFYTVEKMNISTGDFEKLSLINNSQYDDQVQTHAYYDMKPTEGDNFYRVKLSMIDGTDKFTAVKKVTFKRMVGFGAYPNPATDELNINLSEYSGKTVDILIYNTFGKVVTHERIGMVSNPVHQISINDFAAGQYLIRVSAEGKRDATQQVVIQK